MQAPTIYRFFEDSGDPVADLRAGWDTHVGFGLANAALFGLLIAPGRGARSPAAAAGLEVLSARVHRVAAVGRLRVTERRAVELIHATGTGAVLTLLSIPPEDRDLGLADVPTVPADDTTAAALALRAVAPTLSMLTDAERALLTEWLDRAEN